MSKSQDFVRRLPDSSHHFKQVPGLWQLLRMDPWLLAGLVALTAYGLIILYSASGQSQGMVKRQLVFFAIAYGAMFAVAHVQLRLVARWAYYFYGVGLILLVLVLLFGVGAKGAQRWLSLGFIRIQPSEVLKLAVPMCLAAYFSTRLLPPKFKHVAISLMIIAVPTILILKQPDLGTSIMVSSSGLICLFLAGLPWRFISGACLALLLSIYPMWQFVMRDYQKQRVMTLFNPDADALGAGWNTIQAKTAIGSGGVYGKGWLKGTQSQLDFLPETHTDFIIAVLSEEFGLRGFLLLLALYFFVIARGMWIALTAKTTFSRLLGGCIILTFMVYIFVNIAMVAGILPIVGVPLPLVSLGGTSLISLMLGFGLLMAISAERNKTTD